MKLCQVCNQEKVVKNNLCTSCNKNPFRIEQYRQLLAKNNKKQSLKATYTKRFTEIKNLNTPKFWDSKLYSIKSIKNEDGMTKDRIKTVFSFVPKQAKTVLDIGAGYGYIEELLSKRENITLYANDFSPAAVKNLKKRFKGNFSVKSIYKLSYPKKKFDVILVLEVLEHIPPSKVLAVLESIRKLLHKNGTLIISVPMNEGLETMKTNPNGHVRDYTESLIKAELQMVGFKILESKTIYAFNNLYFIKKLISKIIKRWKPNNIVIKAERI